MKTSRKIQFLFPLIAVTFCWGCAQREAPSKEARTPSPPHTIEISPQGPPATPEDFPTLPTGGWKEIQSGLADASFLTRVDTSVVAYVQSSSAPKEGQLLKVKGEPDNPLSDTTEIVKLLTDKPGQTYQLRPPAGLASGTVAGKPTLAVVERLGPAKGRLSIVRLGQEKGGTVSLSGRLTEVAETKLGDNGTVRILFHNDSLIWCDEPSGKVRRADFRANKVQVHDLISGLQQPAGIATNGDLLVIAESGKARYLFVPLNETSTLTPKSPLVTTLPTVDGKPFLVEPFGDAFLAIEHPTKPGQSSAKLRRLKRVESGFEASTLLDNLLNPATLDVVAEGVGDGAGALINEVGRDSGSLTWVAIEPGSGKVLHQQTLATRLGRLKDSLAYREGSEASNRFFSFEPTKLGLASPASSYRLASRLYRPASAPPATQDEKDRAKKLHSEALILLAHDHNLSRQDFHDMKAGGVTAKALIVTTDGADWSNRYRVRTTPQREQWRDEFRKRLDNIETLAQESGRSILQVRNASDILRAKEDQAVGVIPAMEGVFPISKTSFDWLSEMHALGLRQLQVVWLDYSAVADAAGELTPWGEDLVQKCNELGIVISTSHLPEPATLKIARLSKQPILRCHDTPHAHSQSGESTEQMLKAIAESGGGRGVYAVHFMAGYVTPASVEGLAQAIDQARDVVGIDHVALGGDYFPEDSSLFTVPDLTRLELLTVELVRRGYSDEEIRKVLGGNLFRLYSDVWGEK